MVREDQNGVADASSSVEAEQLPTTEPRRSFFARLRRFNPDRVSIDSNQAHQPTHTPVLDLDDQSFFDALTDCVTVVDFWAPWCGPCKILQPRFDAVARSNARNPRLQFVRVNVDESPGVASALNVMGIPTLVVFDQTGNVIDREVGVPGRRRLAQLTRGANSAADTLNTRGTQ